MMNESPLFEIQYPKARPAQDSPSGVLYVSEKNDDARPRFKKRLVLAGLIACCVILVVTIWRLKSKIDDCNLLVKKNITCDPATTTPVNGVCTPRYSCDNGVVDENGICVKKKSFDLFHFKDNRVVLSIALVVVVGILIALVLRRD